MAPCMGVSINTPARTIHVQRFETRRIYAGAIGGRHTGFQMQGTAPYLLSGRSGMCERDEYENRAMRRKRLAFQG